MTSRRRIMKELDEMSKDTISGTRAVLLDHDNMSLLHGSFTGPPDTPYAGGTYVVEIKLPENYPFVPPRMSFKTRIWHPNISSQTGAICLDTLAKKWSPVLTIKTALISLQSLLATPEPSDPQDAEVAQQMIKTPEEFAKKARKWAQDYAQAPTAPGEESSPEDKRKVALDGYDEVLVQKFTTMGFAEISVVEALKKVGVSRSASSSMGLEEEARVVEILLEML